MLQSLSLDTLKAMRARAETVTGSHLETLAAIVLIALKAELDAKIAAPPAPPAPTASPAASGAGSQTKN